MGASVDFGFNRAHHIEVCTHLKNGMDFNIGFSVSQRCALLSLHHRDFIYIITSTAYESTLQLPLACLMFTKHTVFNHFVYVCLFFLRSCFFFVQLNIFLHVNDCCRCCCYCRRCYDVCCLDLLIVWFPNSHKKNRFYRCGFVYMAQNGDEEEWSDEEAKEKKYHT